MRLELKQKLQQQQILAPQMILSMDILLLPTLDLEQRIQKEFTENPALELVETLGKTTDSTPAPQTPEFQTPEPPSPAKSDTFEKVDFFEKEPFQNYGSPPRRATGDPNTKHEALQNSQGEPPGLKAKLTEQLSMRTESRSLQQIGESIINSLDHRGYLLCPPEEIRESLPGQPSPEEFEDALNSVRNLDPAGVAAEDLQDCLLLQLERDKQDYPLESAIIRSHLDDLGMNKIPKIAKDLGKTVDDIKNAVEIISSLDPFPGGRLETERTIYVKPDVVVEEIDEELSIRVEDHPFPQLGVSDSCRLALKQSKGNREITDFLRKKIETAQWLIQALQQRQRTIHDIAVAMVGFQADFMLEGPEHLKAMKMQTVADLVKVHISTISRAIKGKYIQTPQGLFEMRYFFTGGVDNAEGEIESRRNIYRRIREIIDNENKSKPHSDTGIAKLLQQHGLKIARRTVTKYREQEGIPSSRLRKRY